MAVLIDRVVGFYYGYVQTLEEFIKEIEVQTDKVPHELKNHKDIAVFKTIAVKKDYTGYGIGSTLGKDFVMESRKKGIKIVCSIAWKSSQGVNVEGTLSKMQLKPVLEIENFWREDSIVKGYSCMSCGQPPCRCSAVIFAYASGK